MSNVCLVDICDRPVEDAYVCQRCANRLGVDLGDIPSLSTDLDVVLTRQTAYGERVEARSADTPVPFDTRASEAAWVLRNTLSTWVRLAVDAIPDARTPADTLPAMARWMLGRVEWLRHHEAGATAVDEIAAAVRAVRGVCDAPANRSTVHVGPCPELDEDSEPCPGEIRAYFPADRAKPPRMTCTADSAHSYDTTQWTRAGQRILAQKEARRATA